MLNYLPDLIARQDLRLVLVRGVPDPWGQAAKKWRSVHRAGMDDAVLGPLLVEHRARIVRAHVYNPLEF